MSGTNSSNNSGKPTSSRQALKGHDASKNLVEFIRHQMSAKKIVGFAILGAISMVFVFFGYTGKGQNLGVGNVASVNETIISIADLQREEQRITQMYESLTGGKMDLSLQRKQIQMEALRNLVQTELIAQKAKREGLLATDEEIREFIYKKIPFLQKDGRFQREMYFRYLEALHATPGDFENSIRKMILQQKSARLFEVASKQTILDQEISKDLKEIKANLAFVKIDTPEIMKTGGEKATEALKELDAAVTAKDEAKINALVKTLKLEWNETGLTEISAPVFPKLQSTQAVAAIGDLSLEAPLLGRYIYEGPVKYIIKVKEMKREASKDKDHKLDARSNSYALFQNWINAFRKNSAVSVNNSIFGGPESE